MKTSTIKNLKVVSTIVANVIFYAIPAFILFAVIGNLVVFSFETLMGCENMTENIPLMILVAILSVALWFPIALKYAHLYFKFVEKYNFKGWLFTPAY